MAVKCLIVEDDEANILLYSKILKRLNIESLSVKNGADAIENIFLQGEDFELVIMDLNMPTLNGIDAIKTIKKISKIPIIVVTGFEPYFIYEHSKYLNIEAFFTKPVNIREFTETIEAVLEKYKNGNSDIKSHLENRVNKDDKKPYDPDLELIEESCSEDRDSEDPL